MNSKHVIYHVMDHVCALGFRQLSHMVRFIYHCNQQDY